MSFKRLEQDDIVISAESTTLSCWSNNVVTLATFVTSSTQVNATSGDYYYSIYNGNPSLDTSEVQFSLAFAHEKGSGSLDFNSLVPGKSPSSAVYGQYRNLILGDEEASFTFGTVNSEYFYVINVDRSKYKEKLLAGSLELTLSGSGGSIVITDTSATTAVDTFTDAGRVYELKADVSASVTNSGSYGKLLPDVGVILLNGQALDAPASAGGIELGTSFSPSGSNNTKIYNAIEQGASFKLRSEETLSSNFVFVRARNSEFNYTTNPSILTGSGELLYTSLIDSPQTYVTTVGLYNDNNDLLAVAKLSRPLLKDFTKESLIRIKLDY